MKYLGQPQSGSQASTVASRNRFGQYFRTRATPIQPRTTKQVVNRSRLSSISSQWRSLTALQQSAWASWAADHPRTDSLGQTITLSGSQAYVGVNVALQAAGLALISDPPAYPEPTWDPTIVGTWSSTAGSIEAPHGAIDTGHAVVVFASPPRSPGVNFNGDYRVVQVIPAGIAGTSDVSGGYSAVYGVPPDGSRIFMRSQEIADSGWRGPVIDQALIFNA